MWHLGLNRWHVKANLAFNDTSHIYIDRRQGPLLENSWTFYIFIFFIEKGKKVGSIYESSDATLGPFGNGWEEVNYSFVNYGTITLSTEEKKRKRKRNYGTIPHYLPCLPNSSNKIIAHNNYYYYYYFDQLVPLN